MRILFLIILICLTTIIGCSNNETKNKTKKVKHETHINKRKSEHLQSIKNNYDDDSFNDEVIDKGAQCKTHKYYLNSDTTETLTFEQHLSNRQIKKIDTNSIEIKNNGWKSVNIDVDVSSTNIESYTVTYPVWAINCSEYYDSYKEKGKTLTVSSIGGLRFKWRDDGYGIIYGINGLSSAEIIGKYSEEKLNKDAYALNDSTVDIEGYDCGLEQIELEKEEKIFSWDLDIATPENISEIKGKDILVNFGDYGFSINASYDVISRKLIIRGPAFNEDCFYK